MANQAAAEESKRVLIVHSFGNVSPPSVTRSIAFETGLTEGLGVKVDLDEVSLDHARYGGTDMQEALVEYLQKRQAQWQPDLVVPIGAPACQFVDKYRGRLFPQTPVIYTGIGRGRTVPITLTNAAYVGENIDVPGLVDDILQIAPDTTNVVCVIGSSEIERYWERELQLDFARFTNRVGFTWMNELSFDQVLERTKHLPPHSFILLSLLNRDATGVTHNANEALKKISEVANVPVNSVYEEQLGLGIVGGHLYRAASEGEAAARIAIRILKGEAASNFPPQIVPPTGPQYDWRQLQRWDISEERLPVGSIVKFRQPTVWEEHKYLILSSALVVMVQSALIAGLVLNRNRRRKAEYSLRETERQFLLIANSAPVLIWTSGPDKLCTFFNLPWLEYRGRTMEQESGNGWAEGVHPEDLANCLKVYIESFDARQPFTMEYRLRRHDGQYRWFLDRGVPRHDVRGQFLGYIGSCVDVTEKRSAEGEARRWQHELAHVSRLSTLWVLAGSLAHELRQPLAAIVNSAEAGRRFMNGEGKNEQEVREALNDIAEQGQRAGAVITEMRAMLKRDPGQMEPQDLNVIVKTVIEMVRSDLVSRQVTPVLRLDPQLPPVNGHGVQLRQALLNLVLNACDAMAESPGGQRTLTIESKRAATDGEVEVSVTDTGPGFAEEMLRDPFEPFRTTKASGLGLGLAICRSIITAHEGRMTATNNGGSGATVKITLPGEK